MEAFNVQSDNARRSSFNGSFSLDVKTYAF